MSPGASGESDARAGSARAAGLRFRNDFDSPGDVVQYYVARDSAGFVWHGLLDAERTAFTMWETVPRSEGFLLAEEIEFEPAQVEGDKAQLVVRYKLRGVLDPHATMTQAFDTDYRVPFSLERHEGRWKIASPSPDNGTLQPVVLAAEAPYLMRAE